jgi:superfamily II DNA or RNA helicase
MHKIHVKVDGRTAYVREPYSRRLLPHWSFTLPQWNYIRDKYAYWDDEEGKWKYRWDGKIKLFKYGKLPAGLFWATYRDIEKEEHVKFKIHAHHHLSIHSRSKRHWVVSKKQGASDYRYQNECVDQIQAKAYKGGGLILSATGSGKTRMAAQLASRYKCEFLFIVDQIVLLDQAQADISKHLGEEVGNVGEQKFHLRRVTVATIQTLALHTRDPRFLHWFRHVDVILIDEIHEMLGKRNYKVIDAAQPKLVLGLTATLNLKQKHIRLKAYSLCGPVIYEFPLKRGQELGVLSKGICVSLQYDNSIKELDAYDSKSAYDKRIVENAERNVIISRLVKRANKNKYVIVLVDRLKHLEEISERLHGIPRRIVAGSYKGAGIPKLDRIESKSRFEKGKIRVIIASKVFKKGVSINRVDVIIDAAGRKSREDAIQKYGRGVRLHKHKKGLIYIDISDYDRYDAEKRRDEEGKNWLYTSAKRRIRALKAVGVPIHKFELNSGSRNEIKRVFRKAEQWLSKQK